MKPKFVKKMMDKLKPEEARHAEVEETEGAVESSSNDDVAKEVDPVESLRAELADVQEKHLRLYSDFDNYRKRTQKEKLEWIKTASQGVVLSLLPVMDDFERALQAIDDLSTEKEGIALIFHKLKSALEGQGLQAMKAIGEPFDAEFHEAVAQVPAQEEAQKGTIIDEAQKGYMLHDKVIRHAKVIVAN